MAIIYVNQNAAGENNGASWANAYTDLQDAIANAEPNDEVWVAAGTYLPTNDDDREISFNITEFVQFYGGFAGNETDRNQRDIEANPTVLSGNIGAPNDRTDNSYHVVDITGTAATTVLDGFTIAGGYADGSDINGFGSGIYSGESGNARLSNLIVTNNFASFDGAGIYLEDNSNSVLTNLNIFNNQAERFGGGLNTSNSSPTLNFVTIQGNFAGDDGGGATNVGGQPTFNQVIFRDNVANDAGGGFINIDNLEISINNSLFENNQSQTGGAIYNEDSNLTVTNSTFVNNTSDFGGAFYSFDNNRANNTDSIIRNSIIVNNFGALDNLQVVDDGFSESLFANTIVNNSLIEGGYEGEGSNNIDGNPRFVNPGEGNFRLRSNSPALDVGINNAINTDLDLGEDNRIINETVDLGAYEFQDDLPEGTVYRLFNPEVGVHFYTPDKAERDSVIENLPNYEYEGASFQTLTEAEADSSTGADPLTGAKPVFRFFNADTGVHLYTISEVERDAILDSSPNFSFEGISYYAYGTQQEGTIPLYRFFNPEIGAHFYTPFAAERDSVIENLPNYQIEGDGGVAFYVEPLVE